MEGISTWGEYEYMQVLFDEADRLEALLAVVAAGVLQDEGATPIERARKVEGQTAFGLVALALGIVQRHLHSIIVPTIMGRSGSSFRSATPSAARRPCPMPRRARRPAPG